jgi:hypothetical protein
MTVSAYRNVDSEWDLPFPLSYRGGQRLGTLMASNRGCISAFQGRPRQGEREIPGGLQATTDLNGGGRPDLLIIELAREFPYERLTPRNLLLSRYGIFVSGSMRAHYCV